MRISQIHSLVWVGNVLLLAGTGWVGLQFWEAKKSAAVRPTATWPDAGQVAPPTNPWPGDGVKFRHVWETPLNGKVPPPPEAKKEEAKVRLDPVAEFRKKVQITGGFAGARGSSGTVLSGTFGGKPIVLTLGSRLEDNVDGRNYTWRLVGFGLVEDIATATFESRDADPAKGSAVVEIQQSLPVLAPLKGTAKPFVPENTPLAQRVRVEQGRLEAETYRDPATGEWEIPEEEALWWDAYGESLVFQKLKTQDGTDAKPGVRLMSSPGEGTAVAGDRGLRQGDVVVSVNGVAVRTKADILTYLRGDGRDLTRYVVVVERDGAERTVVYNVRRRSRS